MVAIHEQVNEKSSYLRTFSVRLAEERKRLGLSQADFGLLAGVGRTTQNKYESGEGEPGAYYMARVEAMDVDVMYLVTGVLVARFSDDVRRARKTPGWYRHELAGEDDPRYGKYPPADLTPLRLQDGPALPDPGGPDTPDVDSTQPDPNPRALPGEVGRRWPPRRR